MITMKTKYALKALSHLARAREGEPVLIAEISEREGIPRKFLELILRELRQHGILESRKGRGGGYSLRLRPASITLASVIRVLDGPLISTFDPGSMNTRCTFAGASERVKFVRLSHSSSPAVPRQ